jgi:hypothetical protein
MTLSSSTAQSAAGSTGSSSEMQACIANCLDCHAICTSTVQHCLTKGGMHVRPDHIRLLLDCAEICQTSANFMLRGSTLHALTCRACAEACAECARGCVQMADDQLMQRCAEMCRKCEDSCSRMAQGTH